MRGVVATCARAPTSAHAAGGDQQRHCAGVIGGALDGAAIRVGNDRDLIRRDLAELLVPILRPDGEQPPSRSPFVVLLRRQIAVRTVPLVGVFFLSLPLLSVDFVAGTSSSSDCRPRRAWSSSSSTRRRWCGAWGPRSRTPRVAACSGATPPVRADHSMVACRHLCRNL